MYWFDSGKYSHMVLPSEISIERSPAAGRFPSPLARRGEQQTSMRARVRRRGLVGTLVRVIELELRRSQISISFADFF